MKASIDKQKNILRVELPLDGPTPSASGKSLVLASTRGNWASGATFAGQPVIIGLTAYIRRSALPPETPGGDGRLAACLAWCRGQASSSS